MVYDLVLKNGTVITEEDVFEADIAVRGEHIAAVGQDLEGLRQIDARGKYVTPGAVDMHVHMQMPIGDFVSSDDFFTGTKAAALGGTTAIVDFVEPRAQETMLDALAARRALADPKVVVDYGLHMTIGPTEMAKLDQAAAAYEAGCGSFKLYMAYGLCLNDGEMLQAMTAVAGTGGLAVVHAENWDVITTLIERNLAAGNTAPRWHPRSRPAQFEGEAVARVVELADYTSARTHIFHVTCEEAVQQIAKGRRRGLALTGETCPQYLLLTQEVYDQPGVLGALAVCAPPIRDKSAQDALWRALSAGDLQVISTDHCPFTTAEKATGLENFSKIPGGVPSIESRFAAVHTFGVLSGKLSLSQWVDACCTAPARVAGFRNKGAVLPGYDADLVVFDPQRDKLLSTESLHERVDWTPYEGLALQGWPEFTISRGAIVVESGEFVGKAGHGRFVKRR